MTRIIDVAVAAPYPATENHGERVLPYSLCSIVAATNDVAVCPETYERWSVPSGRYEFVPFLMPSALTAIMALDRIAAVRRRGVAERPSYPAIFIPAMSAYGAYTSFRYAEISGYEGLTVDNIRYIIPEIAFGILNLMLECAHRALRVAQTLGQHISISF